ITGYQGEFHTARMLEFGTRVVAGVTPGKGGTQVHGVPVFDTAAEAVQAAGATAACIFVPARFAKDAALEAIEARLDPVVVITEALRMFQADPHTAAVILIGEIGGSAEEEAARFISAHVRKPVVGYIAGRTAPPGKRMGHAGAVISGTEGTAGSKIEALQAAGVTVATLPGEVAALARAVV